MNAYIVKIDQGVSEIWSLILGFPITITSSLIAKEIKCEDNGIYVYQYRRSKTFVTKTLELLYANFNNLASAYTLTHLAKFWHKLLVENFIPREKDLYWLTLDDNQFLCFLLMKFKVSLPLTFFNLMESKIRTSSEEISCFIPYGRVFSELFYQEGIVKEVLHSGLIENLVTLWGSKLEIT